MSNISEQTSNAGNTTNSMNPDKGEKKNSDYAYWFKSSEVSRTAEPWRMGGLRALYFNEKYKKINYANSISELQNFLGEDSPNRL